ncbi:hypothetical protein conserved [Leishmania donovani]|uniref:Uncharacterized protein n=4 Tax=Leishmania donovani species complex TaxID=38574 RepID=A4HUY1_LEIIN|nr:conserved hypothetical protein [Leishmania infantum JPCM5]TPP39854.1 hypothetical protein CGC20_30915 [Leishmania donovani]CAJ1986899.1 hypothetical protein conserved [Leishmania donovani]CAM66244.2 conserved hypothetical protein [Leishmania infantum JPCM5]|eukprot:XP_001463872.2 conserved hypothetical protein [Leishmania infantum JPCM5]
MPGCHVPPARPTPRVGARSFEDSSLISSTSPPASTIPDATCKRASSLSRIQLQQRREEQLRHALERTSPSQAEVSAVAGAAYVQALMALIDQHETTVQQVIDKIDFLRREREARYTEFKQETQQREVELQHLRNERSDLSLQVQEERERSTRLLHENTALYAHQAEQREQLGKLVELCRARGQRLRALSNQNSRVAGSTSHRRRPPSTDAGASTGASCDDARAADVGDEENTLELSRTEVGTKGAGAPAMAAPCSPSPALASPPASMSIHKAVGATTSARRPALSPSPAALGTVAEDAEMAALLNVPYKLQVPSTPFGPSAHTITANTAAATHLLALNEEVNMLRQQLEEQRITYEQERGVRTTENDELHRQHLEKEAKYLATIDQLEVLHEESLRDLVQYRHTTEKQLRDVRGQVDWLRAALQEALDLAEKERRRQHNEVYATEQRMSRQYYPKVQSLHAELEECRRGALAQAQENAKAIAQKDALVAELRQKLKAEVSHRRRIEERYKLEMKGVHSELDLMRQSLRQMERRVYYRDVRDQASEEAQHELERYYV